VINYYVRISETGFNMITSLELRLSSIEFDTHFGEVNTILDQASVQTTWYGSRIITVAACSGSISLTDLARRVKEAALRRCIADDLTNSERLLGTQIVSKLRTWYQTSDAQIYSRNCFTRMLFHIREWISSEFNPIRASVEAWGGTFGPPPSDCVNDLFLAFSEEKFRRTFALGSEQDLMYSWPWATSFSSPVRREVAGESKEVFERLSEG
jgi:hypothetical protein